MSDIRHYIKLGPLGQAFAAAERHVLLIDEIDKADLEFPNDLLRELDEMRFTIIETSEEIAAKHRPVVLITSNNEKELPDAFLRRCIFYFIEFPDVNLMRKVIDVHHPHLDAKLLDQVLIKFYWLREQNDLRKKPSTAELVDWISTLLRSGISIEKVEAHIPFVGALLKKEQDIDALTQYDAKGGAAIRRAGKSWGQGTISRARHRSWHRERSSAAEARLAALDREREDVRSRLKQLGIELAALDVGAVREASAPRCSLASSLTSTDKVALFRSLFRGRDDIYPKLWENSRTGKKGYAPACANEWVRGVCEKPRVRCGECPNQAFLTVTDQVIVDHFQGRHVIGVYALLEAETCWFLAVDFDKQSWMEDAGAFVQTCRTARIPVAVERSRSGNGAHAWFFFAAPVPAVSFERVLSNVKATYVTGLTATLQRRDGHHPIIEMQLGPVRFTIDSKNQTARQPFAHRLIVRETQFRLAGDAHQTPIQDLYRALVADESRNQFIVNDVLNALEEGRSPILLTERRDHLEYFEAQLRPAARNLVVLRGGMGAKQRREVTERIAAIPPNEERLVLATGRYIGEGFDDARLDTLFLTLPVSWKGTLVQYAGRLQRSHEGKREVRIFDYADREVPMLARMFEKRLRGYRAIGYEHATLPAGYDGPSNEPVIELDEAALPGYEDP